MSQSTMETTRLPADAKAVSTALPDGTAGTMRFTHCDRVFCASVAFFILIKLLLMAGLPLVVSNDSMHYMQLSEIQNGTRPWAEWHYGRPPGYPYYLHAVTTILGLTPASFITSNTVATICTGLLLACLLRRQVGRAAAVTFLVLLAAHPLVVGYEHVLLTEVITGCLLALIIAVASMATVWSWPHYVLVGSVVGLAYMTRQTFIGMLLPALLVSALIINRSRNRCAAVITACLCGSAAFSCMTYRWMQRPGEHKDQGVTFLLFIGACNYGLIDSTIDEFAPAREVYEKTCKNLPPPGDAGYGDIYEVRSIAETVFPQHMGDIALRSLLASPLRYAIAIGRNLRLLYGLSSSPAENAGWPVIGMSRGYDAQGGNCRVGEVYSNKAHLLLLQPFQRGVVAMVYYALVTPFRWLTLFLAVCSFAAGITMLLRREWVSGMIVLIPHYLLVAHAVLLTSCDRYAIPMYPALLCMGVWSIWYVTGWAYRKITGHAVISTAFRPLAALMDGQRMVRRRTRMIGIATTVLAVVLLQVFANFVLQPPPAWF